jgi:hypothetical protein
MYVFSKKGGGLDFLTYSSKPFSHTPSILYIFNFLREKEIDREKFLIRRGRRRRRLRMIRGEEKKGS